jgi:hypothetical protein
MRPYPIGNGTVSPRIPREMAALLDALQLEGSNTDALMACDDDDWHRVLEFCDLAHLALPLSQVNTAGFPQWVVHRLGQNVGDNALRFERVKTAYTEAAAALGRAGVSHVVVKGFAQVPDYVPEGRLRSQSDIDVYCPREHLERAQAALMKIGYQPDGAADVNSDHLPGFTRQGDWKWRGNPYDPEMPPGVELHFCLWNPQVSLIEIPEVERFWARRVPRRLGSLEFCALHPVDQFGYLAMHILRGVLTGDWVVHHVLELATFLHNRTRDVEFWSQWHEMHSMNLRRLEALAFSLAHHWFSCALPEVVRVEVDRLPPGQRRWLKRFGGAPLEVMFRHNKDGRLLQLLLTRSRTLRQSVLRKVILPASVPGPDAPAVRIRYRRALAATGNSRLFLYAKFLGRTAVANIVADLAFLVHGAGLWFSTRALNSQFWAFLSVCFFLTSGYPFTSSSSISS